MVGHAVSARCPNCRSHLFTIAVRPEGRVLESIACKSRACRGRGLLYFLIQDGGARALTAEEREGMMASAGQPQER